MDVKYQYVSEPSNHTRSHQAMRSEKNKRNYLSGLSITASLLQGQRFIPQSQVTDTRNLFFFFFKCCDHLICDLMLEKPPNTFKGRFSSPV